MTDAVFISMLNNTFTHQQITRLPNGSGGWQESFSTVGTVVGRMRPKSSREQDVADQERSEITHTFYATWPSEIDRHDRLIIGTETFEVMAIREPSLAGEHVEIDCRILQYEGEGSDDS